jgi:hypothetical protein
VHPTTTFPRLLLTGARAPATLELAQLLMDAGARVHLADSVPWALGRFSTRADAFHRIPSPRHRPAKAEAAVRAIIARVGITHVVPTCEEIFHLAQWWARQGSERMGASLVAPSFAALARWHHKAQFIAAATSHGLTVPDTHLVRTALPPRRQMPGAWVLKPVWSRFGTRVQVVPYDVPWPNVTPHEHEPWVLQRYLEGARWCTWSIAHRGVLRVHTAYEVEATAGPIGAAIAFRAARHEGIRTWVQRFVEAEQVTGQVAFDFIVDGDTPMAIECNPRLTSGVHLLRDVPDAGRAVAGALGLYAEASGNGAPAVRDAVCEPTPGVRFTSALALRTYGARVPRGRDLLDFRADPWPRRLQLLGWGGLLGSAALHGADPRAWSTDDIEWNGAP